MKPMYDVIYFFIHGYRMFDYSFNLLTFLKLFACKSLVHLFLDGL